MRLLTWRRADGLRVAACGRVRGDRVVLQAQRDTSTESQREKAGSWSRHWPRQVKPRELNFGRTARHESDDAGSLRFCFDTHARGSLTPFCWDQQARPRSPASADRRSTGIQPSSAAHTSPPSRCTAPCASARQRRRERPHGASTHRVKYWPVRPTTMNAILYLKQAARLRVAGTFLKATSSRTRHTGNVRNGSSCKPRETRQPRRPKSAVRRGKNTHRPQAL